MRARIATSTAVLVLSALALTACNGSDDNGGDVNVSEGRRTPSASAPSGSASAAPTPEGTGSGDSAKGGATATPAGAGTGDDATAACTTKNTEIRFVQAANRAGEHEAAQGAIEVTNTSGATCTLVGAVTLTAKDDQDKADPIETDNSRNGSDAVDIAPGATATSEVTYSNVNSEGSASGRDVCAVQASSVEIALPKDVARTVRVTKGDGSPGSFDVCGPHVRVGAFHAS